MAEIDTAEVVDAGTVAQEVVSDAPQDLISFLRSSADIDESEVEVESPDSEMTDEAPEAAETDESPTDTETEQPKSFEEMSDDELSEHPKVKSLLARKGESMRQITERETANRLFQEQQKFVASGEATQAFIDLVQQADLDINGVPKVDPKRATALTGAILSRGTAQALDAVAAVLNMETGESFTLSTDEKEAIEGAAALYQKTSNPSALVRAWLKPYARHVLNSQLDSIKAEAKKEAMKEVEAAEQARKAKMTTEERKGRQPTGVNGTPVSTKNTWDAATEDLSRNGVDALRRLGVSI